MNRRSLRMGAVAALAPTAVRANGAPYWEGVVREAAARHGVSPDWLASTCACESGFDPNAVNPITGDSGLFQYNRSTWAEFSGYRGIAVPDIWDGHAQAEMSGWAFANGYAHRWCCSGLWQGGACV